MTSLSSSFQKLAPDPKAPLKGQLGYTRGSTFYIIVPGEPAKYYVRANDGRLIKAFHDGQVAAKANAPVELALDARGNYHITGVDPSQGDAYTQLYGSDLYVPVHSLSALADIGSWAPDDGNVLMGDGDLFQSVYLGDHALIHSEIPGTGVIVKTGTETYALLKINLAAVADPTTSDDSGAGYAVGSYWINTADGTIWDCVDASAGVAVWIERGAGDTGTVTSVALSAPAEFSVSGSPITASGTLVISKAVQAMNKVWAGPASGADAAPVFRLLTAADIPALTDAILSAAVSIAKGGTGQTTKTDAFDALSPETAKGDLIGFDGSHNVRVPVGSDTKVLTADSSKAEGYDWEDIPAADGDHKTAVSSGDTTPEYLLDKLVAGTGITLTQQNPGGNESVKIDSSGGTGDHKVSADGTDTTADFLSEKIVAGSNVHTSVVSGGSDKSLQIDTTIGVQVDDSDQAAEPKLDLKAGTGISLSASDNAGALRTEVTIAADDTDYYQTIQVDDSDQAQRDKLDFKAGSGISLSASDNAGASRTELTITADDTDYYQTVQVDDTDQTQRGILDLIAGSGVTLTPSDDSGGNRTKLTISASGGGGGSSAVYTNATASPPSSPADGDWWLPSDSDGVVYVRVSGIWVARGPLYPLTPPALADFAWTNQGDATASDANGGIFLNAPYLYGSDALRILSKAVPSTPYSIVLCLKSSLVADDFNTCGVCWHESSDDKLVIVKQGYEDGFIMAVQNYDSPSAWNANVLNPFGVTGGYEWFRLVDDGTTRTVSIAPCYLPADSTNWKQIASMGNTDFITPDKIGFFVNPRLDDLTFNSGALLLSWEES